MSTNISTAVFNSSGSISSPVINATKVTIAGGNSDLLIQPTLADLAVPFPTPPAYITAPYPLDTNGQKAQIVIQAYAVNYHRYPSKAELDAGVAGLLSVNGEADMTGTNNQFWGAQTFDDYLTAQPEFNEVHGLLTVPNLTGKKFVVTGMSSGQGFATAVQLAQAGAKVYGFARSEDVYLANMKSAMKTKWEDNMPWQQYAGQIGVAASVFDNIIFTVQDVRDLEGLTVYFNQFNHLAEDGKTLITGPLGNLDGVLVGAGNTGTNPLFTQPVTGWSSKSYVSLEDDMAATPNRFTYPDSSFGDLVGKNVGVRSARYNNAFNARFWGDNFTIGLALETLAANPNPTSICLIGSFVRFNTFDTVYTLTNKFSHQLLGSVLQYVQDKGYPIRMNVIHPAGVMTGLLVEQTGFVPQFTSLTGTVGQGQTTPYIPLDCSGVPFAEYWSSSVKCDPSGDSTVWFINPFSNGIFTGIIQIGASLGLNTYGFTNLYDASSNGYINAKGFRNNLAQYRLVVSQLGSAGYVGQEYMAKHLVDLLINPAKNGTNFISGQNAINENGYTGFGPPTQLSPPINYYNWDQHVKQITRRYIGTDISNADIKTYPGLDTPSREHGNLQGFAIF